MQLLFAGSEASSNILATFSPTIGGSPSGNHTENHVQSLQPLVHTRNKEYHKCESAASKGTSKAVEVVYLEANLCKLSDISLLIYPKASKQTRLAKGGR